MGKKKTKNSIKSAVAKTAYNSVATSLATLETQMNKLADDIAAMNKEVWYGGEKATDFYKYANNVYKKLYQFHGGVNNFQVQLKTVFASATSLTGIQF